MTLLALTAVICFGFAVSVSYTHLTLPTTNFV